MTRPGPCGDHRAAPARLDCAIPIAPQVCLGIFTLEMIIKMIAHGFVSQNGAYLRDPWNQLDFTVVTVAWVPILVPNTSGGPFSAMRAFRALRPLRVLKRLPGMPQLVNCVITSIPKLGNVAVLCAFIFLIFGIAGVQFFKGAMHYRCALPGFDPEAEDQSDFDTGEICSPNSASNPRTAHSGDEACETGTTCEYFGSNPTYEGFEHFDNIGAASIVILQCASFDAWTEGMCAESSGPFESSPSLIRIPLHAGTCSWTTSSLVRGCIMCSSWLSVASSSSTSSSPSSCRNFSTARRYRGSPSTECVRVSH